MPSSTQHRASRRIQIAALGTLTVFALTVPAASAEPNVVSSCGASLAAELPGETNQQALARIDGYYDGLESARVFYSGLPRMWPGKLDTGGRSMVVSFKAAPTAVLDGTHDTYLRDWFQAAPRDQDIYWTCFHEPENDIEDGVFTAEQFRLAWQHIAALAAQVDSPALHATLVLMDWSTDPVSSRSWQDYFPGREYVDVLGWDLYNPSWQHGRYRPPNELFANVIAASTDTGLPFGIAETGSPLITGDDGTHRAEWLRALTTHLTEAGAVFVEYFDHDRTANGGPDYRLRDTPSMTAWREFCN